MTSIRQTIIRLSSSRFIRNVAVVGGGIAAAQAISLAFMPFLTRLYGPEAFGALAAFTAVVRIITPLSTMGFANAIVMPSAEEDAAAVVRLSLVCAVLVAPVALILAHFFQPQLAMLTGLAGSAGLLYLIPVSLLLGGLLSVANQVAIREGLFKAKATSAVLSNLVINITKLVGGLLVPSGLILISIALFGTALNYAMLLFRVPRKGAFELRRWIGTVGIGEAARTQRDFALYRLPQSMINAAAVGLPVILLSAFSGPAAAGQYSVTVLVLGAPVMLLGQSVGEVFYPKITSAIVARSRDSLRLLINATLVLGGLATVPFGVVALFGPELFTFALGEEWRAAGEFARWVAPWLACVLMTRAILASFPALRLQSYLLVQEVLSVSLRSVALIAGLKYWNSELVAVALFSIVGVVLMIALAGIGLRKLYAESRAWAAKSHDDT